MDTGMAELSGRLRSASKEIVDVLRHAVSDGLNTEQLTDLLTVAFVGRNQIDAAVSKAIGVLDGTAAKAPDGELTAGLSSVKNGYHSRPGTLDSGRRGGAAL
jgi:hypothetical protein